MRAPELATAAALSLVALTSAGSATAESAGAGDAVAQPERPAPDTSGKDPSGQQCVEQPTARWFGVQTLSVQAAPAGAELEAKAGACWPLITGQGELFDYTHVATGLNVQATAGYVQVGPYVELLPLSVLGLRAELHWVDYFPAGLAGTGYHARASYTAPFGWDDLPADAAVNASGYNGVLAAWLQFEADLGRAFSVVVYDEAAIEHWSLGDGPYYYNARWDLLLAASDELLRNDAFVGVSVDLSSQLGLGLGPLSLLRRVPAADYSAHQLGGALTGSWHSEQGALRSLDGFLGAGAIVAHAFRHGPFALLSIVATWDLGPL